MFTARKKIVKEKGVEPTELEDQVAQALFDLEQSSAELKADLRDLTFLAAKEFDVGNSGKKAVVLFVPFRLLKNYHKIQNKLVRELEKKFSGKHVVFIAKRTILPKPTRKMKSKNKQKRPRRLTPVLLLLLFMY